MNAKQLFDPERREQQLEHALKRIRRKKDASFPFAFGTSKKSGPWLVVDGRGKSSVDKLNEQARKQKPTKYAVGEAKVSGKTLELTITVQKGSIRAKDVRDYLAQQGLPISKAQIVEAGPGAATGGGQDPDAG